MIGQKFGYLEVIEDLGKVNGRYRVKCKCECGNIKVIPKDDIRSGRTKSCGYMKYKLRTESIENNGTETNKLYPYEKLTIAYINKRIKELRKSISHLEGKTPDVMNKVEWLTYYVTLGKICELQELIK